MSRLPVTPEPLPVTPAALPVTPAALPVTPAALPVTPAALPVTPAEAGAQGAQESALRAPPEALGSRLRGNDESGSRGNDESGSRGNDESGRRASDESGRLRANDESGRLRGNDAEGRPLLQATGLAKSFGGVHAIRGLDLVFTAGAVHSIIGPNGAGKTSLINMLSGVYRPDAGSIRMAGAELAGAAPHRFAGAGIARTFQNLQVFFNMTALENVMTGRHRHERCSLASALLRTPALVRAEAECRSAARELLRVVGLAGSEDTPADALPYGALKRLEIARALAAQPLLLLLDEPAAGLNATEAREIDALIQRLAQDGTTIVLVEHNMALVMEVSDHVFVLDHGQKLAEGPPEDVARDPRVIEAYLGCELDAAQLQLPEGLHA